MIFSAVLESRMKWQSFLTCSVRLFWIWLTESAIADLLSEYTFIGWVWETPRSRRICFTEYSYFASASAEKRQTVSCFFFFHEIGSLRIGKIIRWVTCESMDSRSSHQPWSWSLGVLVSKIPCPGLDFRYLTTCKLALQWS